MGTLAHFSIPAIATSFGTKSFVETGTATGDSLALAAQHPGFERLYSIEIVPELASAACKRFAGDKRIAIIEGDSTERMSEIIDVLDDAPALFWLDAHFPGAHTGAAYDAEPDVARRLPLQAELEEIARRRRDSRDVILIDDARIYQPGPYGAGDLPADWPPLRGVKRSLHFVRALFGDTHGVVVDYADQGYVMVFPKINGRRVGG